MSSSTSCISTPEILVEIPAAVANHVLGESTALLGEGNLALLLTRSSDVAAPLAPGPSGASRTPVLALAVGKAAFPLFHDTVFGTLAGDERAYVFTPEIGGERGGYVKITLPEGVSEEGSPLSKLQTLFEQVLIEHGLLRVGIEAAADELGKSVRDDSTNIGQSSCDSDAAYLSEHVPTTLPIHVPPSVQSGLSSSASGTQSIAAAARRVTDAVSSAAGHAGAWVTGHLSQPSSSHTQNLKSFANAYDTATDGIGAGTSHLHGSVANAAGARIENVYGREARQTVDRAGATVENVGAITADAAVVTSGPPLAMAGVRGAADAYRQEHRQEMQDIQDLQDLQNIQNIHYIQDVQDVQDVQDIHVIQDVQDMQDMRDAQDIADVEDAEYWNEVAV